MTAADVLRNYQTQCDADGLDVQVNRQALNEVLDTYESMLCLIKQAECPNDCDNGTVPDTTYYDGKMEQVTGVHPCQWCAERDLVLGVKALENSDE